MNRRSSQPSLLRKNNEYRTSSREFEVTINVTINNPLKGYPMHRKVVYTTFNPFVCLLAWLIVCLCVCCNWESEQESLSSLWRP